MAVERKVFQSAHLHWAEYDDQTGAFRVNFVTGQTYAAPYIPPAWWHGLISSVSPGSYYRRVLASLDTLEKVKGAYD